jgi:phosphoribosyl 1,2-cyclic phosphate phosphodiesterase
MADVRARLLGTSSAWPIPRPGCRCPQCAEARRDPRLARTRSGLLVAAGDARVLVDAGPDVAVQLERLGEPPRVDAVVVTHTHADHVLGLSDVVHLRTASEEPLVVHAASFHRDRIRATFPSLVREGRERLAFRPWDAGVRIDLPGLALEGFETGHRRDFPTTGVLLRVDGPPAVRVAYATDMGGALPETSRALLRDVDLFAGDGTYPGTAGHGHPASDDVLRAAREVGARAVAFVHLGHVGATDADLRRRLGGAAVPRDGDDLLELVSDRGQRSR